MGDRTVPLPSPPVTDLRTTHTSTVTEEQIDHLGHMNVRFYGVNAIAGTRSMLAGVPGWDRRPHRVHDIYTRHHREQLLGTDLEVRSAFVGAGADGIRIYHELAAVGTGVLAATFVHRLSPVDADGAHLPVPDDVAAAVAAESVELPDPTRTVSLARDLVASAPTLELLRERGLAMREERRVSEEECDPDGSYRVEMAAALTWGGVPLDGDIGERLHETSSGQLMGWASMETRMQFGQLPRLGTRIQSFNAVLAILDKVSHRVQWAFDLDTGALLTAFESVSMAFDTKSRRPMRLPDGYRRREQERLQADLAPQAAGEPA